MLVTLWRAVRGAVPGESALAQVLTVISPMPFTCAMSRLTLPGLPFALEPQGTPPCPYTYQDGVLRMTGAASTDLFIDPAGVDGALPTAGRLMGLPPDGDFQLAALVAVEFASVYDAGAMLLHISERRWAKLAFEESPQLRPTAVTVVTRGSSDDCNSFEITQEKFWLRITRSGAAWAFHGSLDGKWWSLLRYFTFEPAEPGEQTSIGFLAESPTGQGCSATFEAITFTPGAPADLRDGS